MVNARFVIWYNDQFTKLTIKPGQTLRFGSNEATDEGFSAEYHEYHYPADEQKIYCVVHNESRDCDGPYSRTWEGYCIFSKNYDNKFVYEDGILERHLVTWIKDDCYQRDTYAEMDGY